MTRKKLVAVCLLGPTLDSGKSSQRWERWRPTVALCQHEDLLISRLELLHQSRYDELASIVTRDIAQVSPETEVRRHALEIADPWDLGEVYAKLHAFARAYPFRTDKEDYLIHITTGTHIAQICLFLLTESREFPGRLIQTSPTQQSDRKGKSSSVGSFTIIDLDLSKYDAISARVRQDQNDAVSFLKSGIDTKNEAFNGLIDRIEQVATNSSDSMLLLGPTGSGKSHLAKRIYELKKQRRKLDGAFAEINCATLRGDSAMSALFGHVKGAFTGAAEARAGLLRKAHGGLLFLDEIGELGLDEQAMLLRAVEDQVFYPVGSDREVKCAFQLLAGTNRDLSEEASRGTFRRDLLARINLWTFKLPSLSERREDIAPNLEFEIERASEARGMRITFSREAKTTYLRFATSERATWDANFRDLSASVRRMATLARGGRISTSEVEEEIVRLLTSWQRPTEEADDSALLSLLGTKKTEKLDRFDRIQLLGVLSVCREARSISDAGRQLFAASRLEKTSSNDADRLRKYLSRFGLDWTQVGDV